MAAELISPLDEISGIPLPILPTEVLDRDDPSTNWHHAWHANSDPRLQGVGGRALRHSRVQLVRDIDHNHGDKQQGKLTYHDFYIGPPLPTTDEERLKLCVISAAGYVPDEAIDLWSRDEPTVVRMTDEQKRMLREPEKPRPMNDQDHAWVLRRAAEDYALLDDPKVPYKAFVENRIIDFHERRRRQAEFGLHHLVYQYDPLRTFLRQVVLSQDLSHLKQSESRIEEFLCTKDSERKLRLGRWLIGEAIQKSTDHFRAPYRQLHVAGNLHPGMPREVKALVVWKLGVRLKRNELVAGHEDELRASIGMPAAA